MWGVAGALTDVWPVLQVVQLFDSWANLLSPSQFAEFSLPYAQRVIDGVRAQRPGTPLIFHANGGVMLTLLLHIYGLPCCFVAEGMHPTSVPGGPVYNQP